MLTQFQLIRLYFRSLGAQQRRRQRYTPLNQDSQKAQDTEPNCPIQSKIFPDPPYKHTKPGL